MPRNSVQIEVGLHDQLRIRARIGGGFHLLIGDGEERAILSFPHVGKAEEVAAVICTSAIAHGPLGDAVAATEPGSNVAPFPGRRADHQPTPPSAA